jgi:hypothetical protein
MIGFIGSLSAIIVKLTKLTFSGISARSLSKPSPFSSNPLAMLRDNYLETKGRKKGNPEFSFTLNDVT